MTTNLIVWIVGIPVAALSFAYAAIIVELVAAKRRMRLH